MLRRWALPGDSLDAVVLGSTFLDVVLDYDREYIRGGNSVYSGRTCFGGGGANVAYYASALGASVGLISAIGSDPLGDVIASHLERKGVRFLGVRSDRGSTGSVIVLRHPDGERSFLVLLGPYEDLSIDYVVNTIRLARPRVVFLHGYWLEARHLSELLSAAAQEAKRGGSHVLFDPGAYNLVKQHLEFVREAILPYTDVLIPNEEELAAMTGASSPEKAARMLADLGIRRAAVKLGPRGALVIDGGRIARVPPHPAKRVSSVGAGDSFDAAIVYGVSRGMNLESAARLGNMLAARVVECFCAQCEDAWRYARRLASSFHKR
ncbi:MAG: carbohydrate kinase family protein [Thermoproteota archaeon]